VLSLLVCVVCVCVCLCVCVPVCVCVCCVYVCVRFKHATKYTCRPLAVGPQLRSEGAGVAAVCVCVCVPSCACVYTYIITHTRCVRAGIMKLGPSSAGKVQEELTARVPLGRMGSTWDIAMACTYLASPAAGWVSVFAHCCCCGY